MNPTHVPAKRFLELELRSGEAAVLVFLCFLSLLELVFAQHFANARLLALENIAVAMMYLILLVGAGRIRRPSLQTICRFGGVLLLTSFIYNEMGKIIHLLFPFFYDDRINSMEIMLFHQPPTAWMERFAAPWLTEIMMFAYVVYVPLLAAVGLYLVVKGKEGEADRYAAELALTTLFCYLCYVLIPVAGPSRALAAVRAVPLEGYFFTSIAKAMIANVHLPGGAFPSAHCAATTIMLAALHRSNRRMGRAFVAVALLIFISTVYGWFHYVTDVAAGILCAGIVLWLAPKVRALSTQWYFRAEILGHKPARSEGVPERGMLEEGL